MRRFVLAAAFLVLPLVAQQPKGLGPETLFDMESITNPAISPDGAEVIFTRGWVDKMKDQGRSNLWIIDRNGERLRELTSGNWRDSSPVWSPDGKRLAFLSDRDGSTQIHVMWAGTREVAQLTRLERAPSNIKWSPDGKQIAFTMRLPDKEQALTIKLPERPEGAQWARPAVVVDRLSWASDGIGPVPKGYMHVFVVDATTGGTPRQVTSGKFNHMSFDWSADNKSLYVSGIRKPDAEYLRNDSEIYLFPIDGGEPKTLTSRRGPDNNPMVSPNGRLVAYTGYDDQMFTMHLQNIYLMTAGGGDQKLLAGGLPSSPAQVEWAPDSSGLYYVMQERGEAQIYFLPLSGGPKRLTSGTQLLTAVSLSQKGHAAAVRTSFHEPGVLVAFDLKAPQQMKTLVDVNSDALHGRSLGPVEELWFTAADGVKSQGWLIKPVGFEPGKKYPLILYIHGGPWSMYNVGFNWAWQNFAANGYGVLYTNPRGSTGYGQEFVNGIQYSYPGKDYDDLMAGVDEALKKGWIDDRNLFVCGGSGGGVLTAWIVGHTDRFRAAVSMRPVINWHSFVGTTDGVSWYDQFRKKPWEDPMEYALRSPLHYVANVKTPTMVMTGEADLRTPMTQSEEYYRALKLRKVDTLLVRMPDEFHGWRRPSHQLAQQLYLLAWFEKYRVGKAETSE